MQPQVMSMTATQLLATGGYVDTACPGSSRTPRTPRLNNIHSLSNADRARNCQAGAKWDPRTILALGDRIKYRTVVPVGEPGYL